MNNCPFCGSELDGNDNNTFDVNPESALLEMLLAQMARIFRIELGFIYPTEGEADLTALDELLFGKSGVDGSISLEEINRLLGDWKQFITESGEKSTIRAFVENWLPDVRQEARVIPFKPRK